MLVPSCFTAYLSHFFPSQLLKDLVLANGPWPLHVTPLSIGACECICQLVWLRLQLLHALVPERANSCSLASRGSV